MSSAAQQIRSPAAAGDSRSLPPFYQEPVVLQAELHGAKVLAELDGYGFAAGSNAVPLVVDEFMPAVRDYPIVFAGRDTPAPVAVVGLRHGQNLFLDEEMGWREGAYVPAYLRRYPFILTESADRKFRFFSVDAASSRFVDFEPDAADQQRLFEVDGSPTPFSRHMMQFCREMHEAHLRTGSFGEALRKAGILKTRHADMQFPGGDRYRLQGFSTVDPEKYGALPAETLRDWQAKGWLDAIALHLASQQNWSLLMEMEKAKGRDIP